MTSNTRASLICATLKRMNWLSNRVFKSYTDILDHCCWVWNRLINKPWRIISIGLRDWAHRF